MVLFWKPFRVIVSLIFLVSVTAIFIDFRQVIPSSWYSAITWLQFVPSVLKWIGFTGIFALGFAVVLALTAFFGRVYCSTICPLGILQDTFGFISRKFKKKFRFKYAKPNNLRYVFFFLTVIPLFFGSITVLYLLDPYSSFGRMASDLGRPLLVHANNLLATVLHQFNNYSVSPFEVPPFNPVTAIFPVALLVLVIWLSVTRGRLFCNTICPVGTFLGFLSKFSVFRIRIDQNGCTRCGKCAFVCKSQCISIKDQRVDHSRCVSCFNCLSACQNQSISYKYAFKKIKNEPSADIKKRNFLFQSLLLTGALTGFSKAAYAAEKTGEGNGRVPVKRNFFSSPPGSKSLSHFNDKCTACHLCVSACQNGVLQPSMLQFGIAGFMQPYMDYHSGFCNFECTRCGEVCPTGAIQALTTEEKKTCQIGTVEFIKENCIVYTNETSCGSCSEHCPTQAVKMVPYKGTLTIPETEKNICVGCGACEKVCPARPYRAIFVEGNPIHQVALKPVTKKSETKEIEEFPF